MSKKQYGLIIPSKKVGAGLTITRPSIFDEDSDSDTPKPQKPTGQTKVKRQDLISQQKALEEDPTVYQYDEVYDEIKTKRKETKLAQKDVEKKPKYIVKLLEAAERRKREHERRIERQVQKEREEEGEEFKDKESFVTSSYKKKLEELRALEEQEKREEYLESIGDVTKQGNLDGFYRHLYDQKVNYDDKIKKEMEEPSISKEEPGPSTSSKCSNSDDSDSDRKEEAIKRKPDIKSRKYRSRRQDSDSDKSENESKEQKVLPKQHLPSNLDADSDFSVDSSSDSDSEEDKDKKESTKPTNDKKEIDESIEHEGEKLKLPEKGNVLSDNASLLKKIEGKDDSDKKDLKEAKVEDAVKKVEEEKPKKPKVDIWKKRTVGPVLDEAVKRYFERKSARGW